jgi:phosphotransferase system enzyme I (PtsI)
VRAKMNGPLVVRRVMRKTRISKNSTLEHGGRADEIALKGASICAGIGIGRVRVVARDISIQPVELAPQQVEPEKKRYMTAVKKAIRRLHEHVTTIHGSSSAEARAIFNIHAAILNDQSFHERVRQCISAERKGAEWSVWKEAEILVAQFDAMRDPYFKARGEDILDMMYNLISILSENGGKTDRRARKYSVLVSRHMFPSDAIMAERIGIIGFATESSALTSHAAILLKGFGIPSVAAIEGLTAHAREDDRVIVDGMKGIVVVRPSPATIKKYQSDMEAAERLVEVSAPGCFTADGTRIVLKANIENPRQVKMIHAYCLDGIGLFRTEFLISAEGHVPTEDEQYDAYRFVIERAGGRSVVIRTFDIGGEKSMGLLSRCAGRNPALGLRGIRRHLVDRPEELQTQLRAILRASVGADVGILVPMVTTVKDIFGVKWRMEAAMEELRKEGTAFSNKISLGSMIETPAAAAAVDEILSEVSFVSLGTNDLLQYFMAADRDNESVINYQDATSPAFLWFMRHIIEQAREAGREHDVTICGEIASDARVIPHLLRMGYRSFSVSPVFATAFRKVCGSLSLN